VKDKSLLAIMLLLVTIIHSAPALGEETKTSAPVQQLTVVGEAVLSVPADQLRLKVGVVSEAATVEAAVQQNASQMAAVEKALQQAGLTQSEYQSGQYRIQPQWSPRPREVPRSWQPEITGYAVTNTFKIKTQQIGLAGGLINASVEAGANRIDSLVFDLADPHFYRNEAIKRATQNGKSDAETLAAAAGISLEKIMILRLDNGSQGVGYPEPRSFESLSAMADVPTPIVAGEISVTASVEITYQIGESTGAPQ